MQRAEPLPLAIAVQNGSSDVGQILKKQLHETEINYSGHIVRATGIIGAGTVLVETQSVPLQGLLRIMLKNSDNLIADSVFRTLGRMQYARY